MFFFQNHIFSEIDWEKALIPCDSVVNIPLSESVLSACTVLLTRQLFESDLGFSSHRQGTKKASSWLISAVRIGPLAQLLAPFRFRSWNS